MASIQTIAPCLWFDNQAEEAVKFYTGIFKNSRILKVALYGSSGSELHGKPAGTVMTIAFELNGQTFIAMNGRTDSKFNEAISLQVYCKNQEELDYYWETLSDGGDKKEQQSGWLKDKYGVSWQIVPTSLIDMITDQDSDKSDRVIDAMLHMKKLNINDLKRAYLGKNLH
ncbi:VOC family protein [Cellvibrio zantedeschiae]|uniref:VOC family protein n=1 Tax=Cellvibrio zantedeschiae TaxID=1237077 RepID=A0ABQ3APS1_9GAMM|nr:VOC family protein [Cellvibrio zantedeschiae]GGY62221.1 VOC family protein [Cellvibrio zantedeschiae]